MMSKEERDEARKRCESATDGPWCTGRYGREPQVLHADEGGMPIGIDTVCSVQVSNCARWKEDANFIANARTDLPQALDDLDAKDAEIERLRAERDMHRNRVTAREEEVEEVEKYWQSAADRTAEIITGKTWDESTAPGQLVSIAKKCERYRARIGEMREFAQSTLAKLDGIDPREVPCGIKMGDLHILLESIRRGAMSVGATMEGCDPSEFPDIGCDGDCAFEPRGAGLQCQECSEHIVPGDEHYSALRKYYQDVLEDTQ